MAVKKKDLIRHLESIAVYFELKGENPFKISAFRKAASVLEADDRNLNDISDFTSIQGIGKGTAAVITDYMETGSSTVFDQLKKEVPPGLIPLLQIPGLGGKKIAKLNQELGIDDVSSLESACRTGKVQALSGFGKKTEEKILQSISELGNRQDRLPLAVMLPAAEQLVQFLSNMPEIQRFSKAGSLRRMRETLKDLDFIIATEHPGKVKNELLHMPNIKEVIGAGDTKVSLILDVSFDVSVDFRLVRPEQFATALHHFTGSKEHNVRMRQLAKERGEKISEYGVEIIKTGKITTFPTEQAFYQHFNLPFIPPEIREDGKEVDAFFGNYPLISLKDIKGDLHMHTIWSDGEHTIEEMALACRDKGYRYMAITDHSQYLQVANGLSPERWLKQQEEIHKLNRNFTDFTILSGIEMDILPDGTMDFEDEILQEMDIVIASIHSAFSQSRERIMERLRSALQNHHVDIIAHPTGRLIGRRKGYDVDVDLLIELAKETQTVLELNANPNRLDLSAEAVRKAQEAGVKVVINTDAHRVETLSHMEFGVSTAKKGWIQKNSVLNTLELKDLMAFLHNK